MCILEAHKIIYTYQDFTLVFGCKESRTRRVVTYLKTSNDLEIFVLLICVPGELYSPACNIWHCTAPGSVS